MGEGGALTDSVEQRQENQALRERASTLTEAILRISATLDLDTVLPYCRGRSITRGSTMPARGSADI